VLEPLGFTKRCATTTDKDSWESALYCRKKQASAPAVSCEIFAQMDNVAPGGVLDKDGTPLVPPEPTEDILPINELPGKPRAGCGRCGFAPIDGRVEVVLAGIGLCAIAAAVARRASRASRR
jgi:hypothetical protein